MHIWLHRLEQAVDKVIAPLLIALLLIIAGEVFLGERFEAYSTYADYFDILIILIFAVDLSFKFYRVRKFPKFVKSYWVEIIATIPFFLIFKPNNHEHNTHSCKCMIISSEAPEESM